MNELSDMSLKDEEIEPRQDDNKPVSKEIKDMNLEDSEEEKVRKQKEGEKELEDMSNLSSDTSSYSGLQDRIDKLYPASQEYIYITLDIFIKKKSDGECLLNNTCFKSLEKKDLDMIDAFLKGKEKE